MSSTNKEGWENRAMLTQDGEPVTHQENGPWRRLVDKDGRSLHTYYTPHFRPPQSSNLSPEESQRWTTNQILVTGKLPPEPDSSS